MAHTVPIHATVLGLSAVVSALLAVYAYRKRRVPGHLPFALFMGSVAVWTAAYGTGLVTPARDPRVALECLAWVGRATVHVWLLLFALAYTGYDDLVTRHTVGGLLVVPALTVALVWTHPWQDLVWKTAPRVVFFDEMALVVAGLGPVYWATAIYAYLLITATAVVLVRLVVASEYLYLDQSVLLLVGTVAPVVGNVLTVMPPHPIPGFDYTPYGFVVTGLAFGYALFRADLFDLVPATRALGRNAAVADLDAGVLVVDTGRRIIYCNEAAADVVDRSPAALLGRRSDEFVDDSQLDFGAADAHAELTLDDRVYEIRTSPITDRYDRRIGHRVVVHDVTTRTERERRLSRLDDVNRVIRGVNRALVSATTRGEIERELCERVLAAEVYRRACVADVATWTGDADRWELAGDGDPDPPVADGGHLETEVLDPDASHGLPTVEAGEDDVDGIWVVVPLVHGNTVYGALGLYTDRESIPDSERAVLRELGETVGYAINAVETRQLLSAEAVVELDLESRDPEAPLVAASAASGGRVEVTALVPQDDGDRVAYVRVSEGDPATVRDSLATGPDAAVRTVRDGTESGGGAGDAAGAALLEWRPPADSLLGTLADGGAQVTRAAGAGGAVSYEVELPAEGAVRSLVDRVHERFPETEVVAKRERSHPVETADLPGEETLDALTDRQREALEVAYRAGYFGWPRDSSANEVADTMDITAATFHGHLRKAEKRLLDEVFDSDAGD
ncbi:MAG: histidine kinase N-terminal 7TM domain-containing protein [Haloarculaceae archaeon]